jgi:hypothetical protein
MATSPKYPTIDLYPYLAVWEKHLKEWFSSMYLIIFKTTNCYVNIGLQLLSSKFDMEQKKLFRRLHLLISSTYKISFSVFKRGGIVHLARECIPTKTITIHDRDKPWFNSGIKREMKIRDSLHKQMCKQPNINNICKYKVQRNKVNNMIIQAKQQFFFLIQTTFWKRIRQILNYFGLLLKS